MLHRGRALESPWLQQSGAGVSGVRLGFFYEVHRAEIDCLAVLRAPAEPIGVRLILALHALLESARQTSFRVAALGSPFYSKTR